MDPSTLWPQIGLNSHSTDKKFWEEFTELTFTQKL